MIRDEGHGREISHLRLADDLYASAFLSLPVDIRRLHAAETQTHKSSLLVITLILDFWIFYFILNVLQNVLILYTMLRNKLQSVVTDVGHVCLRSTT